MWQFLIVDSDFNIINTIKTEEYFKNYTIYTASHGSEALDVIDNHVLDCIIVDMNVDYVSGLDIIDLLRRNVCRPWIIATCDQSNSLTVYPWLELALLIGADEVLTKPYCLEQLLDTFPESFFDEQIKCSSISTVGEQSDRYLFPQSSTH